jgi:hypothetical protein
MALIPGENGGPLHNGPASRSIRRVSPVRRDHEHELRQEIDDGLSVGQHDRFAFLPKKAAN